MTLSESKIADQGGFTLVEIIVTLVAAGILSIFYIHFMGTAMDSSWKSVELVAGEAEAEGQMEEIIAYFTSKINSDPDNTLSIVASEFSGDATMVYITYDSAGNESAVQPPGTSNNLKVTVEAPGNDFTTILTKSRNDADNPIVSY
ncbi:MAG: prepilin-type N-terminal cleavage/methylation domain-containing protein [Desulfobacteraceae bacterium]|jgi:prepilin-type N-terminal cleavage/methylation domain-containing protein|nr:prepilin-type N-terminal cleavage/methylation domain-containing protein [Desulfobacteraceae bacterium]